jgi:hypothetical protein
LAALGRGEQGELAERGVRRGGEVREQQVEMAEQAMSRAVVETVAVALQLQLQAVQWDGRQGDWIVVALAGLDVLRRHPGRAQGSG